MGKSSEKKRKATGEAGGKPSKKVAIDGPAASAKVSSVLRPQSCPPIVAMTPGIQVPTDIKFDSYAPRDSEPPKSKSKKHAGGSELLLHSTAHRSMNYTAREEGSRSSKPLLNHFVGVYDPKTGQLQVMEAKKMVVRGQVRSKQPAEPTADELARKTMWDRRTDLGQAFGTKKAKKALNDKVMNAIAPANGAGTQAKVDAAGKAMLSSVGAVTSTMATREQLQAIVDEAKPVPIANIDAEEIQDVYDPEEIIGADILKMVPILEWQEKVKHGDSVQVPSRFAASRINAIATNASATMRLRVLRYFVFVLLFYLKTKPGKAKGTRKILSAEKLMEALDPAPKPVVESIRRKFSEAGEMRKFHIDLLMTHMCAFACIIDNFEVDTGGLTEDLRLNQKDMNAYFHEIGARVKPVANQEVKGAKKFVARLAIPLDFPKQRFVNPGKR